MPRYLVHAKLTTAYITAMMKEPEDRSEVLAASYERAGAKMTAWYFSPDNYSVTAIVEVADVSNLDSLHLAVAAGGSIDLASLQITRIVTAAEWVEPLKLAGAAAYSPPAALAR